MINREQYTEQIVPFTDKPLVKVITGIRRSGKSVVLRLVRDESLRRGIREERITYLNFEGFQQINLKEAKALYAYIRGRAGDAGEYYAFLGEIQEMDGWKKVVGSLLVDLDTNIYVTGSNSCVLSPGLVTCLTGRYIAFHVMTSSLREYLTFHGLQTNDPVSNRKEEFRKYLRMGKFPAIHITDYGYGAIYKIVYDIYSSVIPRDTVQRHNTRNMGLFERVVKFIFNNIGNKLNVKNIADHFRNQQRKVGTNTIYNCLNVLESVFIIQCTSRYDIKGKGVSQTNEKHLVGDLSLIYSVMGYRDRLITGTLGNLARLELKRRGYEVYANKQDDKEVDFVAIRREERICVQIMYRLASQATVEREFAPLLAINDRYPKYIVGMDSLRQDNAEGVRHRYIVDLLLGDA